MMGVFHYAKDGTPIKDLNGHVVKMADAEPLYRYIIKKKNPIATYKKKAGG